MKWAGRDNAAAKGSGHTMQPTTNHIPQRFPVVLEDRILYWMHKSHCANFGILAKFEGNLDIDRLNKAMHLCLDAEPILGCRFVNQSGRQYWERLPDLHAKKICTLVKDPRFLDDPAAFWNSIPDINVHQGPQASAWVLRGDNDVLCLRVNHVVGDGAGVKELAALLADTYNRLKSDPNFIPKSNPQGKRGLKQVLNHLSMKDRIGIGRRAILDFYGFIKGRSPGVSPQLIDQPRDSTLLTRVIGPRTFAGLKAYGKARAVTINDIVAAAAIRAFYTEVNSDPRAFLRVVTTADLRRYIPGGKAGAICNLSGFSYINLGQGLPATYDGLLKAVSRTFKKLKQKHIGLGNLPVSSFVFGTMPFSLGLRAHDWMGDFLKKISTSNGNAGLLFTNAGKIEPEKFKFGKIPVSWAGVTATRSRPPVFTVCISGFQDNLLVSTGFSQNCLSRGLAGRFLDHLEQELDRLHGQEGSGTQGSPLNP